MGAWSLLEVGNLYICTIRRSTHFSIFYAGDISSKLFFTQYIVMTHFFAFLFRGYGVP